MGINMAAESKLQSKILRKLESDGHIPIKIVVANKGGHSDIVGCALNGRFFAIEVKDDDEPTALQAYRIKQYTKNNAIAFYCDSWADFCHKYKNVEHLLQPAE